MNVIEAALAVAMLGATAAACSPASSSTPSDPRAPAAPSAANGAPSSRGTATGAETTPEPGGAAIDRTRRILPIALAGRSAGGNAAAVLDAAPACPPGLALRQGDRLVVDGRPFAFFGINAPYLTNRDFPSHAVEPVVRDLSSRGVNTVRVWYFADDEPERLEGVLDLGARYGVRYIVVLEDNVFKGRDWFFGDDDEERYRPHLTRTVERFRDRPEILAWEVINEPNCGGRYDEDCVKTIRDWLTMATRMVKALDPCHPVSTGMIGAGNYEEEWTAYRRLHDRDTIDLLSAHRDSTAERNREREIAADLNKPFYLGEIYHRAYDEGCSPLDGGAELARRSELVKDDLRQALRDGVDGYLLWDYAAGRVENDGEVRHYCGEHGFERDDPLWRKLEEDGTVPPVPWQG